jgi:hypothetical protein
MPTARQWANSEVNISGYITLGEGEKWQAGDVLSDGHHMGIFAPRADGTPATISAATDRDTFTFNVVQNDWGTRKDQKPLTARRFVGDLQRKSSESQSSSAAAGVAGASQPSREGTAVTPELGRAVHLAGRFGLMWAAAFCGSRAAVALWPNADGGGSPAARGRDVAVGVVVELVLAGAMLGYSYAIGRRFLRGAGIVWCAVWAAALGLYASGLVQLGILRWTDKLYERTVPQQWLGWKSGAPALLVVIAAFSVFPFVSAWCISRVPGKHHARGPRPRPPVSV